MKIYIIAFTLIATVLSSCVTERYMSDKVILGASMPISFNETNVLLHCNGPIYKGLVEVDQKDNSKLVYVKSDFKTQKIGDVAIEGSIRNIYFEDLNNNTQKYLSDRTDLLISRIQYLPEVKEQSGKEFLLYVLLEGDVNVVSSIYMSNIDGTNFTRLNPQNENFEQGKWMADALRFYFSTSRSFSESRSYYYIDFKKDPNKIVSYKPVLEQVE